MAGEDSNSDPSGFAGVSFREIKESPVSSKPDKF